MIVDAPGLRGNGHCRLNRVANDQIVNIVEAQNHARVIKAFDFLLKRILSGVYDFENCRCDRRVALDLFNDVLHGNVIIQQFRRKIPDVCRHSRNIFHEILDELRFSRRRKLGQPLADVISQEHVLGVNFTVY